MSEAKDIAAALRAAKRKLPGAMMRAERENAKDALAVTLGYFSGPYSTAALRKLYNLRGPYSAVSPHPPAPAQFVNVQSGATREQWGMTGPEWQADRIVTTIENPSKVAEWLLKGTSKMTPRPYIDAILDDIMPRVEARRKAAWDSIREGLPTS